MRKLIKYTVLAIIMTACMKNINNKKVTIAGRVMESCGVPASNTPLIFVEYDYSHALISNDVWEEFSTDQNGYFQVNVRKSAKLKLHLKNQFAYIVSGIEVKNTNINLGEVYSKEFQTNFKINLDVLNQYTENDTLIIEDYNEIGGTSFLANNKVKYYPGPFTSGELEVVQDYKVRRFPISYFTYTNHYAPEFNVRYRIRTASGEESNNLTKFRLSPICSNEFSEVTLVIE